MKNVVGIASILAIFALCGCNKQQEAAPEPAPAGAAVPPAAAEKQAVPEKPGTPAVPEAPAVPEKQAAPEKPAAPAAEKPPVVIARVDEAVLTDRDLEKLVQLRIALEQIKSKRFKDNGALRARLKRLAPKHFVNRELLLKYARIAGYEPSVEERADFMESVAKRHKVKSVGEIYANLSPELLELFKEDLEKSVVATLAERKMRAATPSNVTDEEVNEMFGKIALMNEAVAATNALVYAKATNVWQRLERGDMTFAEAAEDYTEAEDEAAAAGEWGTFSMRDLETLGDEQALIDRLPKMKAGDITEPIESDNGLAILMLVAVHNEQVGRGQGEVAMYQLSRVFFRLPLPTEVPTFQELKENMQKLKVDLAVQKKIQSLAASSRLEGYTPKSK